MKKYLCFVFSTYYPSGGWSDFVGSADTITEAYKVIEASHRNKNGEHWHVVNISTGKLVYGVLVDRGTNQKVPNGGEIVHDYGYIPYRGAPIEMVAMFKLGCE